MKKLICLGCLVLGLMSPAWAGAASDYPTDRVLTHREQAPLVRGWIEKRFDTLLPGLMRRERVDMWIIVSREYNDDPVFRSMAPHTTYSSRRRTILVFFDRGPEKGVERLTIGRFDYDRLFTLVRTHNDAQWEGLRKVVEERDPKVIGINTSEAWNHADGLTANEKDNLVRAIAPKYAGRLKSAEMLAVGWLEVKLPEETEAYRHAMKVAHKIVGEAFSNKVITPGKTTTEDVVWWMRQRVGEYGLGSEGALRDLALGSFCAAATVLIRVPAAVAGPALAGYALLALRERAGRGEPIGPMLAALAGPVVALAAIHVGVNYAKWGTFVASPFLSQTGLLGNPFSIGLVGLLVSPGAGLFAYSPLVLLAPWFGASLGRAHRAEWIATLVITLCFLLLGGSFPAWTGLWSAPGPRYLFAGSRRESLPGLGAFLKKFPRARPLVVGTGGVPVEEFLGREVSDWVAG